MLRVLVLAPVLTLAASSCGSSEPGADGDDATGREVRTVSHSYGEAEVPVDPRRVVVLNNTSVLGTALLLDVPIVGYPVAPFGDDLLPYFDESKLADAESVVAPGSVTQPNIEAIAALRPDLIIGTTAFIDQAAYNRLVEIAPTVAFENNTTDPMWKQPLRQTAAVFQATARIDERIAEHETRVEEVRTALRQKGTGIPTVTLANLRALDDIRIYTSTCSSATLEEVGFSRPAAQQGAEPIELSIERLGELDAEALIYFVGSTATNPEEAAQAEEAITSNPLWGTLDVAQRGQTFEVDPEHWFTCGTLQAQNLILDDIERIFLGSA